MCVRVKCSLVYLNNCHFSGIFILQLNTSERQGSVLIRMKERMLEMFPSSPREVVCLISIWLIRYAAHWFLLFFPYSSSLERVSAHGSPHHVSSVGRDILVLVHIITNIFLANMYSTCAGARFTNAPTHLCVVFGKRQTHLMKVFCPEIHFTWNRLIKTRRHNIENTRRFRFAFVRRFKIFYERSSPAASAVVLSCVKSRFCQFGSKHNPTTLQISHLYTLQTNTFDVSINRNRFSFSTPSLLILQFNL